MHKLFRLDNARWLKLVERVCKCENRFANPHMPKPHEYEKYEY